MQERIFERYLGDAVHVHYDGLHVILEANRDWPDLPTQRVALDPTVLGGLRKWLHQLPAHRNDDPQRHANRT